MPKFDPQSRLLLALESALVPVSLVILGSAITAAVFLHHFAPLLILIDLVIIYLASFRVFQQEYEVFSETISGMENSFSIAS